MPAAAIRRQSSGKDLFAEIGAFLAHHGLGPDPAHYSFAHAILSCPDGPTALAVRRMSDNGLRLTCADIQRMGGTAVPGPPVGQDVWQDERSAAEERAETLVAQTRVQVEGFADMVRSMHDDTREFGRDLAERRTSITAAATLDAIDQVVRITDTMLGRIRDTEARLARTSEEVELLRERLTDAQDDARRDSLTDLPNRRAFEEAYDARDSKAGPWCLAICDIDRFKRFNDQHGHAVGDRVLKAVGAMLAEGVQNGHDHNVTARFGGEEFVVLAAGSSLQEGARLLDTVRADVGDRRLRTRDTDKPLGQVTISAGITCIRENEPIDVAFDRADRLLYEAKAGGRDQVVAG